MATQKLVIRNVSVNTLLFNYQNSSDNIWYYQIVLLPGQEKHIWCVENTLSYSGPSNGIIITNKTTNVCGTTPTPTPSITPTETPTPTPTPSITPTPTGTPAETPTPTPTGTPAETPTPTPTEVPIPLDDLVGIIIPDNDLYTEEILNPFFIHNEYIVCCSASPITLYSNDETIIVGSYLYTNTSLSIPFFGFLTPVGDGCNTSSGVLTDNNGQVTDVAYVFNCEAKSK